MPSRKKLAIALAAASAAVASAALADTLPDSIVQGSLCVGIDCVNPETFGFDTIRLKENNTRIKFDDTSTSGGYPSTDWQLTANDNQAGGANKFSIEDVTAATVPFTISGAAPSNALFVADSGRVGLGTAAPARELHIVKGDTPTIRFDQSGGGFSPQNWEFGANEANFFLRDANANRLVVRVRPDAPSNAFYVEQNGDVGFGTASPLARLHIVRDAATGLDPFTAGGIRIETKPATPATTLGLVVTNNGPVANAFADNDGQQLWYETYGAKLPNGEGAFQISEASTPGVAFSLQSNGNLTLGGVLAEGSSRAWKHDFERVNAKQVLESVARLEIAEWRYKHDGTQAKHVGPMAEDFHAAFGVGSDDKHIASIDMSGVALAAIQALHSENKALKSDNAELRARLDKLEALVSRLGGAQQR